MVNYSSGKTKGNTVNTRNINAKSGNQTSINQHSKRTSINAKPTNKTINPTTTTRSRINNNAAAANVKRGAISIYSNGAIARDAWRRGGIPSSADADYNYRRKRPYIQGKNLTTSFEKRGKAKNQDKLLVKDVVVQLMGASAVTADSVVTKKKKSTSLPLYGIFIIILCAIVGLFWVSSYMETYANSVKIAESKANITKQLAEKQKLELESESRVDLAFIESEAVNRLGMVKKEFLPQKYVSLRNEEKIVIKGK